MNPAPPNFIFFKKYFSKRLPSTVVCEKGTAMITMMVSMMVGSLFIMSSMQSYSSALIDQREVQVRVKANAIIYTVESMFRNDQIWTQIVSQPNNQALGNTQCYNAIGPCNNPPDSPTNTAPIIEFANPGLALATAVPTPPIVEPLDGRRVFFTGVDEGNTLQKGNAGLGMGLDIQRLANLGRGDGAEQATCNTFYDPIFPNLSAPGATEPDPNCVFQLRLNWYLNGGTPVLLGNLVYSAPGYRKTFPINFERN